MSLKTFYFHGYNVQFSPHSQIIALVGGTNFGITGYNSIFYTLYEKGP